MTFTITCHWTALHHVVVIFLDPISAAGLAKSWVEAGVGVGLNSQFWPKSEWELESVKFCRLHSGKSSPTMAVFFARQSGRGIAVGQVGPRINQLLRSWRAFWFHDAFLYSWQMRRLLLSFYFCSLLISVSFSFIHSPILRTIHGRRYLTECKHMLTGQRLLSGFPVSRRNSRSSAARKVAKNTASRGVPVIPVGNVAKSTAYILPIYDNYNWLIIHLPENINAGAASGDRIEAMRM